MHEAITENGSENSGSSLPNLRLAQIRLTLEKTSEGTILVTSRVMQDRGGIVVGGGIGGIPVVGVGGVGQSPPVSLPLPPFLIPGEVGWFCPTMHHLLEMILQPVCRSRLPRPQ